MDIILGAEIPCGAIQAEGGVLGVARLFCLLPCPEYSVKRGNSRFVLASPHGEYMSFVLVTFLLADSSLVAFLIHLIWNTLLFPSIFPSM